MNLRDLITPNQTIITQIALLLIALGPLWRLVYAVNKLLNDSQKRAAAAKKEATSPQTGSPTRPKTSPSSSSSDLRKAFLVAGGIPIAVLIWQAFDSSPVTRASVAVSVFAGAAFVFGLVSLVVVTFTRHVLDLLYTLADFGITIVTTHTEGLKQTAIPIDNKATSNDSVERTDSSAASPAAPAQPTPPAPPRKSRGGSGGR